MEIHSQIVTNFYKEIWDDKRALQEINSNFLTANYLVNESSLPLNGDTLGSRVVLVCPDEGARPRVEDLVNILHQGYGLTEISTIYLDKFRKSPNNPEELEINVNGVSDNFDTVEGKHAILVDDMVDTGGTMSQACKQMRDPLWKTYQ